MWNICHSYRRLFLDEYLLNGIWKSLKLYMKIILLSLKSSLEEFESVTCYTNHWHWLVRLCSSVVLSGLST